MVIKKYCRKLLFFFFLQKDKFFTLGMDNNKFLLPCEIRLKVMNSIIMDINIIGYL
jgi:hypothetical protein